MKLWIRENSVDDVETLRFNTFKSGDEQFSFEEYVDRMKQGQNDIYCITDESIAMVSSSSFLENLRKNGYEVPYMADPVDAYAVRQLKEFDGTKLKPTMKERLNLGEELKIETTADVSRLERDLESHDANHGNRLVSTAQSLEPKSRQDLHDHLQQRTVERTANIPMITRQKHSSSTRAATHQASNATKRKKGREGSRREREKGRKDEGRRDQEGRKKEKEREPEVKKDVTDWIVVTRNRRQRKMIQIFVRVNGSKATPMEVNLTDDRVEDVMRRIQNDEDAYVTLHGRVLKRGEKLKSCEVTDGCTIQVTSRLRGGGRHKNKRSMTETKRNEDESGKKDQQVGSMSDKCQEMTKDQKDALIQTIERNEGYRKLITTISEAENRKHEIQCFGKQLQEQSGVEEERAKVMEWGMRWVVEARKRGRGAEQEQRRQEEQRQGRHEEQGQSTGQEQGKKDKQVRFGEEEQTKKTWMESTDEPEMMSESAEVRTGRGSVGLVQGGTERCLTNKTHRKGKGKGNGGKRRTRTQGRRRKQRSNACRELSDG